MNYQLVNKKKNLKKNYQILCKNIKSSIFCYLGFNFFNEMVLGNFIHVYNVKKNKTIASIITVIDYKNYKIIKKKIFYHLIKNPFLLINNFIFLLKSVSKNSNIKINSKYLHLLHLIIFKKEFLNISLKKKDLIFNKFYKKILANHNSNFLFLCFEENNNKANNYYLRNKFKFFFKNRSIIYLKKKFKI